MVDFDELCTFLVADLVNRGHKISTGAFRFDDESHGEIETQHFSKQNDSIAERISK